jgi:hypothetical protein
MSDVGLSIEGNGEMSIHTAAPAGVDFGKLFLGSDIRPFLIGTDECRGGARLALHTAQPGNWFSLKRRAAAVLRGAGIDLPFRLHRHSQRGLDKARSLEEFVGGFAHDRVEHDPTGVFDRAGRLVRFARALRAAFGARLVGVYWNSRWRSVYLVLDHKAYVSDARVRIANLAEAEGLALEALAAEWPAADEAFLPSLRLGFELPGVGLVPVDRRSYFRHSPFLAWLRGNAGAPIIGAMLGLGAAGTAASAADLPPQNETYIPYAPPSGPAVSEPNGKLSVFGGVRDEDSVSSDGFGGVEGSYSIPLDYRYGAQVDGMVGLRDGDAMFGVGGHLFWRDPSQGLLGVTGSYVGWDADNGTWGGYTDMARVGVEGEMYLDQLTLAAQAGVQFGQRTDDGLYGRADLKWYASPDLALKLGVSADDHRDFVAHAGTEFQAGFAGIPGLTLFADAAAGDDDYYKVYAGVRIYFGTPKSLIDRHRLDDPESNLAGQASEIGTPAKAGVGGVSPPPPPSYITPD